MIHKLKDGDELKILPFINEFGKAEWYHIYDMTFCDTGVVYDDKGYLRKMYWQYRKNNSKSPPTIARRYMFHCYINGENKLVSFGKRLFDFFNNNNILSDIVSDDHILVKIKKADTHHMKLNNYDGSCLISKSWYTFNSVNKKERLDWVKSKQPDIDLFLKNKNINDHREGLNKLFGSDLLSEIIKNERNEKLETILK